jgi:hypothetical protein
LDYLDGDDEFKADSIYANARQILQQFEVNRRIFESDTANVLTSRSHMTLVLSQPDVQHYIILKYGNNDDEIGKRNSVFKDQ